MKKTNIILLSIIIVFSIILSGCVPCNTANNQSQVIDIASIPAYSGQPYIEINNNEPFFAEKEKKNTDAFETYSNLDALGRCGVAYANICKELMPTGKRGEIGDIKPSGWHTTNYHELVEDNYLYNRCHLIAHSLAGENANEKNLITGTRYMNVEGMLPFENKVAGYVDSTNNHALYRVTPIFEGNNLVASGVLMEAYSVEDRGRGIQFCVYCYNVQPSIDIDYATGDSKVSETSKQSEKTSARDNNVTSNNDNVSADYILNTNSKRFHRPDCQSVSDMKEKNKKAYSGSRQELVNQGYVPCGSCNP